MENPSLAVGAQVTLTCESGSGNPAPSLALYLGEEQVASSVAGSTAEYTFTVQTVHDTVHVYCTAHNSMVQYAAQSQVQVLRLKCKDRNNKKVHFCNFFLFQILQAIPTLEDPNW
jgi:hypothetical protein